MHIDVRQMRTNSVILALTAVVGVVQAVDKPIDLTGTEARKFKAQLGQTVTLRGRLEQGMQGPCLFGATPTNVVFYVIPELPTSGPYTYPKSWTRLIHQPVRLTGQLKFRSFDRSKGGPTDQGAPEYYYMVLQRTKIERFESK